MKPFFNYYVLIIVFANASCEFKYTDAVAKYELHSHVIKLHEVSFNRIEIKLHEVSFNWIEARCIKL